MSKDSNNVHVGSEVKIGENVIICDEEHKLLGDKIESVFRAFQIHKVMKAIEKITNSPCGCADRKEQLNALHNKLKDLLGNS